MFNNLNTISQESIYYLEMYNDQLVFKIDDTILSKESNYIDLNRKAPNLGNF